MVGGAQSGLEEHPAGPDQELAEPAEFGVQADRLFAMELEIDFEMVLQVLPDTRERVDRRDARIAQDRFRANARALQDHWRGDCARRQDDFLVGMQDHVLAIHPRGDADGAFAVEHDLVDEHVFHHRQVPALQGRTQIGA